MTTQNIPSVTKQELGDLEIIIPNLDTQKQIIKLDFLKRTSYYPKGANHS